MKIVVSSFFLLAICTSGFAQRNGGYIIHRDTINLRGRIYEANGKPSIGSIVISRQRDLQYNRYPIDARTDSNGYFELKGARPNDTLLVKDPNYSLSSMYSSYNNSGSRYMVIYLPPPKLNDLNSGGPVIIKAVRKNPKVIPAFKIVEDTKIVDDWESYPAFPGGASKFFEYIQKRIAYPEKAIINNIEGTVEVSFMITRDGSLSDINVLKGIGYGCDEQVIVIIKKSPRWKPGIFNGRPLGGYETVSVKFSLTDK